MLNLPKSSKPGIAPTIAFTALRPQQDYAPGFPVLSGSSRAYTVDGLLVGTLQ